MLSRLAQEFPLEVTTMDVNSVAGRELAREYRVIFPPGLVLDGQPFSYGRPSERKLRRELEARLSNLPHKRPRAQESGTARSPEHGHEA